VKQLALSKLGLPETTSDEALSAVLRGLQLKAGLEVTGLLDEPTVALLGPPATAGLLPLWWPHDAERVIRERVGDEQAIRRWQSAHRRTPTGVPDEQLARELGD
jgi:hypothetical protein